MKQVDGELVDWGKVMRSFDRQAGSSEHISGRQAHHCLMDSHNRDMHQKEHWHLLAFGDIRGWNRSRRSQSCPRAAIDRHDSISSRICESFGLVCGRLGDWRFNLRQVNVGLHQPLEVL